MFWPHGPSELSRKINRLRLAPLALGLALLAGAQGKMHDPFGDALAAMRVGKYEEAAKHFRISAREGQDQAYYMLGVMHQTGQGVPKNYRDAAILFRHVALKGHKGAQMKLAALYEAGLGMKQDPVLAYMWYEVAALQYELEAYEKRNRLATRMQQSQIDLARRKALNCLETKFKRCE